MADDVRKVVHVCDTSCRHGGPIRIKWPFKENPGIEEDWPDNPDTYMPPGVAVSMGAKVELLEVEND